MPFKKVGKNDYTGPSGGISIWRKPSCTIRLAASFQVKRKKAQSTRRIKRACIGRLSGSTYELFIRGQFSHARVGAAHGHERLLCRM